MVHLKQLRIAKGLTQSQLAAAIGQTQGSVCHYESGKRKPDIDVCHLLVKTLSDPKRQITIEDIFPHPNQGLDRA